MDSRCILCCHRVQPVKSQESALDSRLFISLCKSLKTCGPNSFQSSLTENPVCSSCLDLLKNADETLMKLEELELKIAKIAEDLKCTLKHGYSILKESWELPEHEFEYVPTDLQKFLLKAVGVDTDEDYIEVVPLSHDEFESYEDEEVYEENDSCSPVDTGTYIEGADDDAGVVEAENSESIQCDQTQASERSSEVLSTCSTKNKRKLPIKDLPSGNSKRKCDENLVPDSIEGSERLGESVIEIDTSEVRSKRRISDGKSRNSGQQKRKYALWHCFYNGCRKGFESIKTLRGHMLKPHEVEVVNTNLEFNCKKCEQSFPAYVDMFNHLASEHAAEANPRLVSVFCQKCGNDFGSVKALKVHMKDHPGQRRLYPQRKSTKCCCFYDGCHKIFPSVTTLRKHLLEPHKVEVVSQDVVFSCDKCNQSFPTYDEMFDHVTSHHGAEMHPRAVKLFCQKCGNDFGSVQALKVHMKDHPSQRHLDPQRKSTNCCCFYDGCHKNFPDVTTLRAHLLEPHKVEVVSQDVEFSCHKCNQSFPTYVEMFNHVASHHGTEMHPRAVKLFCQKCGQTYPRTDSLKVHMRDHRRAVFGSLICNSCGKSFVKECFIRRHERVCGNAIGKGLWSCRICRKTFLSRCLYMKHMMGFNQCTLTKRKGRGNVFCRGCGESFSERKEHAKHNQHCRKCPRMRLCNYRGCTKGFKGELMIESHLREPHKLDAPDNGKHPYFTCDVCQKVFASYKLTCEHIRTVHPSDSMKTRPLCQICGRFYKTVNFLQTHLKFHAGEISFICETCGKTFVTKADLGKHIRASHCPSKLNEDCGSLICKGCSKVFKFEKWLRKHRTAGCPAERKEVDDIRCRFCAKEFPNHAMLKIHEYRHTRRRVSCEVCQKTCVSRADLVRHRRSHFPEEKLACHLCPATFCRSWRLTHHINMKHFGKPRQKCPQCDYVCLEKKDMETHMRKHTGEKPFMCDICGMTFRSQPHMKNHRKYHIGKPHKCEHCGHEFMHRYRYERHMRTHTNPQLHWKVRQKLAREAAKKAQSDGSGV